MDAETKVRERRGVIFIQDFIDVSLTLATIRSHLDLTGTWLTNIASAAEDDGEALRLQIGPSWAGGHVTHEVEVTVGVPRERGDATVVSLAWGATGLSGIFPALNGDLELAPLDAQHCRLTLAASYLPPFGAIGRELDRALMHRVAQSTVRSFLSRVATGLEGSGEEHVTSSVLDAAVETHT